MSTKNQIILEMFALLALLALVGCAGSPTDAANDLGESASIAIECLVAYRSGVAAEIGREETVVLSADARQQTLSFGDLVFHADYTPGDAPPNEHALRVWVTTGDGKTELVSQLFQLPVTEAVRNQFIGDHSFTGLSYVYHPISRAEFQSQAELQYTCKAQ